MKARDIKIGDVIGGVWRITDVALLEGPMQQYVEYAPADPKHLGVTKMLNASVRPAFEVVLVKMEDANPSPAGYQLPPRGDWFFADEEVSRGE